MSVHEDIKRKFMVYSDVRVSHTGEVLDGLQLDGLQLSKLIDDLADLLEREYVKGGEMQKKLMRIRFGLATEGDN